ncbi:putative transcription factor B3-Domain family [Helianthus annuus]|nr:putative transcription factor B3-Domain family [Helianthus annuus]KAJ0459474.1 putative transcription factor B3-Domain family [Helianthus annuus]
MMVFQNPTKISLSHIIDIKKSRGDHRSLNKKRTLNRSSPSASHRHHQLSSSPFHPIDIKHHRTFDDYSPSDLVLNRFSLTHNNQSGTTITLVDESGTEFKTKYLKARHVLSGGWKGFSFAQKLLPGGILFFHLVGSCKLQLIMGGVHIVRRYRIEVVEAAVCLLEMHPRVKKNRALTSEKLKHEKVKVKVKGKRQRDTQRSV